MKASLLQQVGQRPLSMTRSRHEGHKRGSATSRPRRVTTPAPARRPARTLRARRARREGCTVAAVSIGIRYLVQRGVGMSGNPIIFDRALLRLRRRRARALGPETFLIDRVAADLAERLGAVLRQFAVAVDLGTPADAVRGALADVPSVSALIAARSSPDGDIVADEEAL